MPRIYYPTAANIFQALQTATNPCCSHVACRSMMCMYFGMNSAAIETRKLHGRSRVGNGTDLFVEPTDRRSAAARRFKDIFNQIMIDLGGNDSLSEAG